MLNLRLFFCCVTWWVCQYLGQAQHWYAACKDGLSECWQYVSENWIEKRSQHYMRIFMLETMYPSTSTDLLL